MTAGVPFVVAGVVVSPIADGSVVVVSVWVASLELVAGRSARARTSGATAIR